MDKKTEAPELSALKLALEALEEYCKHGAIFMPLTTLDAIREALAEQPAQKRPQNCGTGYCSCIECVMEPEQPTVKQSLTVHPAPKWQGARFDSALHEQPAQQGENK